MHLYLVHWLCVLDKEKVMGRFKRLLVVATTAVLLSLTACGPDIKSTADVEDKLKEYMTAVYAPETMQQFRDAKEESTCIFTEDVKNRFFVAYADELSEADLLRRCEVMTTHGAAENQSDGRERYLVEAYLYETDYSDPIMRYFTFFVNEEGKIDDFMIQTKEEWTGEA